MQYITTTDLRTQSSHLVALLSQGRKTALVHRSKIIGEILPVPPGAKLFDVKKFRKFIKGPSYQRDLSYEERDVVYRKHLEEKYGKGIS